MASLVLPRDLLAEIRRVVFRTSHETGIRLVGEVRGREYIVRHVIAPGGRAVHRETYYECDNAYAERRFNELLRREANLQLLGELHVHPDGDPRLSRKDLATVRSVVRQLPFFVAGVIVRRPFGISPFLFRHNTRMRLNYVLF